MSHYLRLRIVPPELAEQVIQGFRFLKPYYEYLFSLAGDPTPEGM